MCASKHAIPDIALYVAATATFGAVQCTTCNQMKDVLAHLIMWHSGTVARGAMADRLISRMQEDKAIVTAL